MTREGGAGRKEPGEAGCHGGTEALGMEQAVC